MVFPFKTNLELEEHLIDAMNYLFNNFGRPLKEKAKSNKRRKKV